MYIKNGEGRERKRERERERKMMDVRSECSLRRMG